MWTKLSSAGLILTVTVLAETPALAQRSADDVTIRGNTTIDVNAKNVTTSVSGSSNKAVTNIGALDQSTNESKKVTVDVKNVENIVSGHGKTGCISIGSNKPCE